MPGKEGRGVADNTLRNSIELSGEKQYKAAMAEINRALKEHKSAVKAASAEYDAADEAMRSQTEVVQALETQYDGQQSALQLMNEQLDKVTEQYGENSVEAVRLRTQINNMRAETAKTEAQLRTFRAGLDSVADAAADGDNAVNDMAQSVGGIGEEALSAQDDVAALSKSIADAVGRKVIEFTIGGKALGMLKDGLESAISGAFEGAVSGQTEDALTRALAGNDALSERRTGIKDAVDRTWSFYVDGTTTARDVAAIDTALGNFGIEDEERVKDIIDRIYTIDYAFSQGTQDTINRATSMVNTFGVSWEDALDLMTKGMQDMNDGGAQLLSAYDDYSAVYAQLGYDAEEMYSAIKTAANDKALGKDSTLNKGVENFINTLTSGSKESQEALKALGFEITDLPAKFQEGGETAARATQDILTALLSIEDNAKRNDLGKALFGDKIWTDSAGAIADVILSGYGQIVDASGAAQDAMGAVLDTWEAQSARAGENLGQATEKMVQPFVEAGTEGARAFSDSFEAGNGLISSVVAGLSAGARPLAIAADAAIRESASSMADAAVEAGIEVAHSLFGEKTQAEIEAEIAQIQAAIDDAFARGDIEAAAMLQLNLNALNDEYLGMGQGAAAAFSEGISEGLAAIDGISEQISEKFYAGAQEGTDTSAADTTAQRWVDVLRGSVDAAAAEDEQSEAIKNMLDGMLPDTTALTESMKTYAESHKEAVVAQMEEAYGQEDDEDFEAWKTFQQAMIDSAYDDTVESAGELGEDAAQADVDAIEDAEPDAQDAGEGLGASSVSGVQKGLYGMYDAGAYGADGAVSGLMTGVSAAAAAGRKTAQAYNRAFREELAIASPSRVMYESAGYAVEGVTQALDAGVSEVYARGAALADALAGGYAAGTERYAGADAPQGGAQSIREEIVDALCAALGQVGFYVDGERLGGVTATGVSREISRKASGTMAGRFAAVKGW